MFRKTVVRGDEVIDVRQGDLTEIRNYGNWNLKGVKHRSFSRVGDDEGVAMKLMGKRVVVVSTSEPERVFGLREGLRAHPQGAGRGARCGGPGD